jgi:hypothetical protein
MELRDEVRRLIDVGRALRTARAIAPRACWPRERLERHQREGIDAIVRHAMAHSPFYRERFAGLVDARPVELAALPVLDKATMMDRFDDLVCDRRLRRDALLEHLDGLDHDALYRGEHRVMTTSGSSGQKGLSSTTGRRGWLRSRCSSATPRWPASARAFRASGSRRSAAARHVHEPAAGRDDRRRRASGALAAGDDAARAHRRGAQRVPARLRQRVPLDGRVARG